MAKACLHIFLTRLTVVLDFCRDVVPYFIRQLELTVTYLLFVLNFLEYTYRWDLFARIQRLKMVAIVGVGFSSYIIDSGPAQLVRRSYFLFGVRVLRIFSLAVF